MCLALMSGEIGLVLALCVWVGLLAAAGAVVAVSRRQASARLRQARQLDVLLDQQLQRAIGTLCRLMPEQDVAAVLVGLDPLTTDLDRELDKIRTVS